MASSLHVRVCLFVQISPFLKNTNPTGVESTLMTLFLAWLPLQNKTLLQSMVTFWVTGINISFFFFFFWMLLLTQHSQLIAQRYHQRMRGKSFWCWVTFFLPIHFLLILPPKPTRGRNINILASCPYNKLLYLSFFFQYKETYYPTSNWIHTSCSGNAES